MKNKIINLADKRPSVNYTIEIEHKWDGTLSIFVHDLQDDERSKESIAWALYHSALAFGFEIPNTHPAKNEASSLRALSDDELLELHRITFVPSQGWQENYMRVARAIEAKVRGE